MKTDSSPLLISMAMSCLILCAPAAVAQEPVLAEPGARLRLTIANGHQRMRGQYVRRVSDSLLFLWADSEGSQLQQPIALRDINRMEISAGRDHPMLKTTAEGAAMGAAFGLVAGRLMGASGCAGPSCLGRNETMVAVSLAMSGVGGIIGFVRAAKGFDRWAPATVAGWQP